MKHYIKVEFNSEFKQDLHLNREIMQDIIKTTNGTCEIEFDTHYPTKYRPLNSQFTHNLSEPPFSISYLFDAAELESFTRVDNRTGTGELSNTELLGFVCKHFKTSIPELQKLAQKRKVLEFEIIKLEKELNDLTM